jgi:hypothetical protein
VYVTVAGRPAHVAEVGRQLRQRWRDRATTRSAARAQPGGRGSARSRTARPDDAGYDPEEWDDQESDDESTFDDEDEHDRADPGDHHRAGERSGWRGDADYAPRTMRSMLEAITAARNTRLALPSRVSPTSLPSRYRPPAAVLYVGPDQHAPAAKSGTRCPHALALPISVVLPVLARCSSCGAIERVTGGSQLTVAMIPADAQPAALVNVAHP